MQCLYCDRRLGLFQNAKGAFCSDEHEALYRSAAQRRLESPYVVEDLAQLLKATQADSGATVEAPAPVSMAGGLNDAVAVSVTNSMASGTADAVPEVTPGGFGFPTEPPAATLASSSESLPQSDPQWSLISDPPPAETEIPTDRRTEPRVKEIKILRVATLRDPEKQVTCALVDTSDAGIQFTSDIEFRTGDVLIADFPDQIALAEVRYSQAKDGRFAVGRRARPDHFGQRGILGFERPGAGRVAHQDALRSCQVGIRRSGRRNRPNARAGARGANTGGLAEHTIRAGSARPRNAC